MRAFVLILFGFVPLFGYSQLTQGQVYNYEVGDIIETSEYNGGFPFVVRHNTVIEKEDLGSIIIYTFFQRIKNDGPPPNFPTYDSSTVTLTIYPATTAQHYPYMLSCAPFQFSMDSSNCELSMWIKESDTDSTCFEPPQWTSLLLEGFGGPYYYGNDATIPEWWTEFNFIYGSTQNSGECGNEHKWWSEPEPTPPEPENEPENEIVAIWDVTGRRTEFHPNVILFYLYSDGSIERKLVFE